jgi:predicted transcriptional regulator
MSTTTIRTDDELKARAAAVAERAAKTAYAFILDAITQTVERVEQDNAFQALGQVR